MEFTGEPHKLANGRFMMSDVILGGQDGLVNVLGVILGVAAASQDPRLILAAGLAATFAESVSMGAVAYTSTISDSDYYKSQAVREQRKLDGSPEIERDEVRQIYKAKGFEGELLEQVVVKITSDKALWLKTLMREKLELAPVDRSAAFRSGFIVGISALVGSFVPLMPFFFIHQSNQVGMASIWAMIFGGVALFLAGAYKSKVTIGHPIRSGLTLTIIGLVSALIGYGIGVLFQAPAV